MPKETKEALEWAFSQTDEFGNKIDEDYYLLVDMVRKYFNEHDIEYDTFSYDDLIPYF